MNDSSPQAAEGVRSNSVEAVVALILLGVGLVTVYESWQLGARWTDDGPGAGYFPFYIGLVICFASVGILVQALRARAAASEVFVDGPSFRRVLQVLLPAALFVAAIHFIGVYVVSALYIGLFMVVLGKYSGFKSVALVVGMSALFFMMFEVWFKVPLFKGALDPTRFLGY